MRRRKDDPFVKLGSRLRELVREETHDAAPSVERFKVTDVSPLTLDQLDGDVVLEEGDPDFIITTTVDDAVPDVGDAVLVQRDSDDDWIALAVVKRGNDD